MGEDHLAVVCDTVALKGTGGRNEPVLIVFMSKVEKATAFVRLCRIREDGELSLRQCSSIVRLDNCLIKRALCENKRAWCGTFESRGNRTML